MIDKLKRHSLEVFYLIVILLIILFVDPDKAYASVLTDQQETEKEVETELTAFLPDGYKYYISHFWAGEEIYPLIFFKDIPVFDSVPDSDTWGTYHHVRSSDGSDPLFYDFFSEADLLNFVENNVLSDNVRIRENYARYARLNVDPVTYYTNVDLIYSDTGAIYAARHPYTSVVTELVPDTETTFVGFSSGDLTSGVLAELLPLLPVLVLALVGYIGFRKAVDFVLSQLRGA